MLCCMPLSLLPPQAMAYLGFCTALQAPALRTVMNLSCESPQQAVPCCCGVVCRYASFKIQDPEEKVKARQELLAGGLNDKLKLLSKLVVSAPVLTQSSREG